MRGVGPRAVGCVTAASSLVLGLSAAPASASGPTLGVIPGVVSPGGVVVIHNAGPDGLCPPEPDDDVSVVVQSPTQQTLVVRDVVPNVDGNWSSAYTAPTTFGTYTVRANCGERFGYATSSFVVDDGRAGQITGHAAMSPDGVRTIQVDADWSSYDRCSDGSSSPDTLGFPNGECQDTLPVHVTNVGAASDIFVEATSMLPGDASTSPWQLCAMDTDLPSSPVACDGPTATDGEFAGRQLPGADQFHQDIGAQDQSGTTQWAPVSSLPGCDATFSLLNDQGCWAYPGQETDQYLRVMGPSSTTDESTSWSNTITWVAMP